MPSTRDLRRRIQVDPEHVQITKAMQMVRRRRCASPEAALAGRPYATLMNEVLAEVTRTPGIHETR